MKLQIVNDAITNSRYGGIDIIIRFSNNDNNSSICNVSASLISCQYGKLDVYDIQPPNLDRRTGYEIPASSFVDAHLNFNKAKGIGDGDKLEVTIKNKSKTTFERKDNEWSITKHEDNSIRESEIVKSIEHFEAIEEKIGIMLQNFSVNINSSNSLSLFFEVLSISNATPESFSIEVAAYDKNGKVRCLKSINKFGDFLGFEVFAYHNIEIAVSEISKIRVYPLK